MGLFFLLVVIGIIDAFHKYFAVVNLVGHRPFEQFADEAARRSQKVVAQMLHTLAE